MVAWYSCKPLAITFSRVSVLEKYFSACNRLAFGLHGTFPVFWGILAFERVANKESYDQCDNDQAPPNKLPGLQIIDELFKIAYFRFI